MRSIAAASSERCIRVGNGCAFRTGVPVSGPSGEAITHELADKIDEELRDELLAMMAEDQAVRTGVAPPGDDRSAEELFGQMGAVDEANSLRIREILDEHGWPGWSMVGEDGSLAAWVVIQHADRQLDLQELGLRYLHGAVDAGDASAGDLAYLVDRVRVAKGQPQVYGTQLGAGPRRRAHPADSYRGRGQRRRAASGSGPRHPRGVLRGIPPRDGGAA